MSKSLTNSAAQELTSIIERVERVSQEIKERQEDRREIFVEAASRGYDVKALKRVIKERSLDRDELDEFEAMVRTYWGVLGR
jgi:uncharacterized protein (UPF0335 family)